MKITVVPFGTSHEYPGCRILFAVQRKESLLLPMGEGIDRTGGGMITSVAHSRGFTPDLHETMLLHLPDAPVLLVGVGDLHALGVSDITAVAADMARMLVRSGISEASVFLEEEIAERVGAEKAGEAFTEGLLLATYRFDKYRKSKKPIQEISHIRIVAPTSRTRLKTGVERGEIVSAATRKARDLVNEPASVTTPAELVRVARSIANAHPSITCSVLNEKAMEKLGMGGILGIAKGSDEPPSLIVLSYKGGSGKTVAIVGKGVTFDSGGLSLKSQEGMETMKIDMAGAAAVLGIFSALPLLKPDVNVIGVIPAVENMPSGAAIRPGDVVRTHSGKTIEIISTDAEGRVILADALSWVAQTRKPDIIVDLATLTGACMIALGEDIAGLFSTDPALSRAILAASATSGEPVWELPMFSLYEDLLKSDIADIRNVTRKRYGGAITAALFLKAFVPDSIPFAHVDIAGPAIAEKDAPLTPVGGTGFGVRLILSYLRSFTQEA